MDTINTITKETKRFGWIQASVIVAIVIVMNMFFNYAISLIYTEPQYDTFCPTDVYNKAYNTSAECVANGGAWSEQAVPMPASANQTAPIKTQITGYCNPTYTCQKNYDSSHTLYDRNVFIILVALGVLALVAGAFVEIPLLSVAFSWAGVLSIIIASIRYWSNADNLIHVLILAAALGALIWLAVKKFNK